jgi:hypothetical protein
LAAIFYLPSLVPLAPSVSDSYVFGYNNRAGIVLLLLLVAIGSVWTKGLNLELRTTGVSQPIPLKTLIVSLIAVLFGCLAMYMLAGRFGGFGESSYQIDHVWMLSQGKIPYANFEFAYGASFLYCPLLLRHLLPINLVQAYYLFWILNWLLGTLLLYATINMVDYSTTSKSSIFLLIYGAGFFYILTMGTNYTLLRFTCPLFFILVIHKLFNRSGGKWQIYAVLLAVVFTITLLLISPEIAIAYAFACMCIFLLSSQCRSTRSFALFAGLLLTFAVVLWAALKLHVLDTLKAIGGGAFNFPISLAPHILLFFAAIFVCSCYVFLRFSERRTDDNTIGLIAFSIPMIAAALGRCDPGHVFWNGEGIFLASMFYVSNHTIAWKWYRAAFVIVMLILQSLSTAWLYTPSIARVGLNSLGESSNNSTISRSLTYIGRKYIGAFASPTKRAKWEKKLANGDLAAPDRIDLTSLYPSWHGTFLAPFGYKPNGIGTYLSDQIDYGYYDGLADAFTVDTIHAKLAEIEHHPDKALLLPDHFEDNCKINIPAERLEISALFVFPYLGRAVHPESIDRPICDYIIGRYILEEGPTPHNFGYGLWVAKPVEVPQ